MLAEETGPGPAEMKGYLKGVLQEELAMSKSHVSSWGRSAMSAVDMDDAIKLMQVYQRQAHLGAAVDARTSHTGYGNYMWTPWIHQFLGDTCLHICLKQKKKKCISILLLMDAAVDIENDVGSTAEQLAPQTVGQSLTDLRRHAMKYLLTSLPAHHFKLLPDQFLHRNIENEAWALMRQGRLAYSEDHLLPNAGKSKVKFKRDENEWRIQRNTMYDTIENLRRQVLRRSKIKQDQHLRETGLAAAAANAVRNATKEDEKFSSYYKRLNTTPGFRFLKFVGWNQRGGAVSHQNNDDNSDVRTVASTVSGAGTAATAGGLADIESILPHRYITVVSTATNLKYVHIGPEELKALAGALRTDDVVTELTISSASVSDAGVNNICPVIATMSSLIYLDLSYNAITDEGCSSVAKAIEMTTSLRRVTLRGNRIGDKGAEVLLNGVSESSTVRILNISKNRVSESFKAEMMLRIQRANDERKSKFDEDESFPDSASRADSYGGGDSISSANSRDSYSRSNSPSRSQSQNRQQYSSSDAWKDDLHDSLISSPPGSPNNSSRKGLGSRGRMGSRRRGRSPNRSVRMMFVPIEVEL